MFFWFLPICLQNLLFIHVIIYVHSPETKITDGLLKSLFIVGRPAAHFFMVHLLDRPVLFASLWMKPIKLWGMIGNIFVNSLQSTHQSWNRNKHILTLLCMAIGKKMPFVHLPWGQLPWGQIIWASCIHLFMIHTGPVELLQHILHTRPCCCRHSQNWCGCVCLEGGDRWGVHLVYWADHLLARRQTTQYDSWWWGRPYQPCAQEIPTALWR